MHLHPAIALALLAPSAGFVAGISLGTLFKVVDWLSE